MESTLYEFFKKVQNAELGDLEQDNFIEKITDSFNKRKVKLFLKDLQFFIYMTRMEIEASFEPEEIEQEIFSIPEEEFHKYYDLIPDILNPNENHKHISLEKLLFPHDLVFLYALEKKIKSKLNDNSRQKSELLHFESKEIQLFNDYQYSLFVFLNDKYTRDNKTLVAKYSYMYHFLKYEQCISGKQNMYIRFIKREFDIDMSKVLPKTYKYEDEISTLLHNNKVIFDNQYSDKNSFE
jgi:hypothetical protein